MRAIASSTACSGVMPSATTRWTAFGQTSSATPAGAATRPRRLRSCSQCGWVRNCMAARHPVRVARVEPERLLEQRRHRRQDAVAGEVEPVRQPALADQEAHELLRGRDVPAVP